ncbi:hypothetical protein [Streptomyces sp. NPDC002082]|uniref:hypothetical protein n=1 Tax=Streptomyces sp. NPDC002082 TaxID=3154772 RepID=UPI003317BB5A
MISIAQIATLATFEAVRADLSGGHNLADHTIGQTDHQAADKTSPSAAKVADGVSPRRGRGASLGHVPSVRLVADRVIGQSDSIVPDQRGRSTGALLWFPRARAAESGLTE